MSDILIRDVDPKILRQLEERARSKGHSLQDYLKHAIESLAPRKSSLENWRERVEQFQRELEGRPQSDSVDLIREDRER
ncbi:MAG: hypothetical protein WEB00_12755 [Dehalococcoidia bacterium]